MAKKAAAATKLEEAKNKDERQAKKDRSKTDNSALKQKEPEPSTAPVTSRLADTSKPTLTSGSSRLSLPFRHVHFGTFSVVLFFFFYLCELERKCVETRTLRTLRLACLLCELVEFVSLHKKEGFFYGRLFGWMTV